MTERRVVRSLDVRTVVRACFAISLCLWGIAFVGFVALYLLGLVSGGLGGVEGFIASLGFTDFRLSILPFLVVFVVVAGVASALAGIGAGLIAYLYNAVFPLTGGVEIVVDERKAARPTPVFEAPAPTPVTPQPSPSPPPVQPPPAPVHLPPPPTPAPEPSDARHWPHDVPGGTPTPGT